MKSWLHWNRKELCYWLQQSLCLHSTQSKLWFLLEWELPHVQSTHSKSNSLLRSFLVEVQIHLKNQVLKATQNTPQSAAEKSYSCLTAFERLSSYHIGIWYSLQRQFDLCCLGKTICKSFVTNHIYPLPQAIIHDDGFDFAAQHVKLHCTSKSLTY